jgi:hypothetical protein
MYNVNPIIKVIETNSNSIKIFIQDFGQTQNAQARDLTIYINNNPDVFSSPINVKRTVKGQIIHELKSLFSNTEYYIFAKNNLNQISNIVTVTTSIPVTPTPTPSESSQPTPTPTPTPTFADLPAPSLESWFTALSTFNLFDGSYFSIGYKNDNVDYVTACRYDNSHVLLENTDWVDTTISLNSAIEVKTNYPQDKTLFWIGGFNDYSYIDNNPEDSILIELPINGYASPTTDLNNGFANNGDVLELN